MHSSSEGAGSAADYLYPRDFYLPTSKDRRSSRALPPTLVPRSNKTFPHPGVSPYKSSRLLNRGEAYTKAAGLDPLELPKRGLGLYVTLIPVVTFLAPLASNFEGLKDR